MSGGEESSGVVASQTRCVPPSPRGWHLWLHLIISTDLAAGVARAPHTQEPPSPAPILGARPQLSGGQDVWGGPQTLLRWCRFHSVVSTGPALSSRLAFASDFLFWGEVTQYPFH